MREHKERRKCVKDEKNDVKVKENKKQRQQPKKRSLYKDTDKQWMNPYPVGAVVGCGVKKTTSPKAATGQIVSHGTTQPPNCTCPKTGVGEGGRRTEREIGGGSWTEQCRALI